ncbi:MAG: ribonuclease III, partial [Thermoleophilia bacterium]|nr:ribonuclease III [Thermoleophilia bacterium]
HPAWTSDRISSYERLEFLGDSVLELAIARALYDRFPDFDEGDLTKIRAHVVSRHACAAVARELGLGELLVERAGDIPAPELERIARSRNVLAALLEAAIAAVYLEHDFEHVEAAVVAAFDARIVFAQTGDVDSKTALQERLARSGRQLVYEVVEVEGPVHERVFVCAAVIEGERIGQGRGSTKKAAEQLAAFETLAVLDAVVAG